MDLLLNRAEDKKFIVENERESSIKTTGDDKSQYQRSFFEKMTLCLLISQNEIWSNMSFQDKMRYAGIINSQQDASWNVNRKINSAAPNATSSFLDFPNDYMYFISSTSVQTPRGGAMQGCVYEVIELWINNSTGNTYLVQRPELSNDAKAYLNNKMHIVYGIYPISDPSIKYNCHSYAWYSQTNCNYWINQFSTYGYSLVSLSSAPIGAKVVYHSNNSVSSPYTHSAIIETKNLPTVILKSKWGMCGLYRHTLQNCPYYFTEPAECAIQYYQ